MNRRIAEMERRIREDDRVQLCAGYFSAPTQNNGVVSGEIAARRMLKAMSPTPKA